MNEQTRPYVRPHRRFARERLLWLASLVALAALAIAAGELWFGLTLLGLGTAGLLIGRAIRANSNGGVPELGKSPGGLVLLTVASGIGAAFFLAASVWRLISDASGSAPVCILGVALGILLLFSARMFGAMLLSVRRLPRMLGEGETLVAVGYGRTGNSLVHAKVVGVTNVRVVSLPARVSPQHNLGDSLLFAEITYVNDDWTDLEVGSERAQIRITKALPTQIARMAELIEANTG